MNNRSPNTAAEERRLKNMLAQRRHRQAEKNKIQDLEAAVARLTMQLQRAQQYSRSMGLVADPIEAGPSVIYQVPTLQPPPTHISAPSPHRPFLATAYPSEPSHPAHPPHTAPCQNCHLVRKQQDELSARISRMQQTIQELQAENHSLEQSIVQIMQDQERLRTLGFPPPS
ncbi:hypothetical protein BC830DRAFT_1164194 [Chytriomyces sp. MP71]|nr:hypothetical protein BC830DRAFT_1164194 [Chytriomyces sp. MP71]